MRSSCVLKDGAELIVVNPFILKYSSSFPTGKVAWEGLTLSLVKPSMFSISHVTVPTILQVSITMFSIMDMDHTTPGTNTTDRPIVCCTLLALLLALPIVCYTLLAQLMLTASSVENSYSCFIMTSEHSATRKSVAAHL